MGRAQGLTRWCRIHGVQCVQDAPGSLGLGALPCNHFPHWHCIAMPIWLRCFVLARRDRDSRRAPAGPSSWLGRLIIPDPTKGHQPVPSHDPRPFYALIPLLSILAITMPQAFLAVTGSISAVEALARLSERR